MKNASFQKTIALCANNLIGPEMSPVWEVSNPNKRGCSEVSKMTSFSDLFKLGKEVLKTETFVLHEAETRGADGGVCARYRDGNQNSRCSACVLLCRLVSPLLHVRMAVRFGLTARARIFTPPP